MALPIDGSNGALVNPDRQTGHQVGTDDPNSAIYGCVRIFFDQRPIDPIAPVAIDEFVGILSAVKLPQS